MYTLHTLLSERGDDVEFNGSQHISAPRSDVWRRLNDPEILRQCLAGCEQYEQQPDGSYEAVIVASVGPVKARFKGIARFSNHQEDIGYRVEGNGSGGVAGFGKLSANINLVDVDGGTTLHYAATAQLGGKLAQIGSRLVGAAANRFLAAFFLRFEELVQASRHMPSL